MPAHALRHGVSFVGRALLPLYYEIAGSIGRSLRGLRSHAAGTCNVCGCATVFICTDPAVPRNNLFCLVCGSPSRKRHVAKLVLEASGGAPSIADLPRTRPQLRILNTDAHDPFTRLLGGVATGYAASEYIPGEAPGAALGEWSTCQDLERVSFADGSFDLVITEDVFEHVRDHERGLREIHRILIPGGHHVFTVPYFRDRPTEVRVDTSGAEDRHLLPPEYHQDPIRGRILSYRTFGTDLLTLLDTIGFDTRVDIAGEADQRRGIVDSLAFVSTRR